MKQALSMLFIVLMLCVCARGSAQRNVYVCKDGTFKVYNVRSVGDITLNADGTSMYIGSTVVKVSNVDSIMFKTPTTDII